MHLVTAQSFTTRDHVLSSKNEGEIIKDVIMADTAHLNNEKTIVRQTKSWTNKTKNKEFNVNTTKRNKQEIFEEKVIIDNFGNEQKVFVRSELNVRDETTNTNQNINIKYQPTIEYRRQPVTKKGRTAEQKTNVKLGIFVPLSIIATVAIPTSIYWHRNPDKFEQFKAGWR
jgi:hypothetical protein